MNPAQNQDPSSPLGRGITDYFHCFRCDQDVWDCDHLIDNRLADAERFFAQEPSPIQSIAYNGKLRTLEVAYKPSVPFIHGELPLPAPPRVLHFFNVPRYAFNRLVQCATGRAQERYLENYIKRYYECQTVRTACRLPRIYKWSEARNVRRFAFEEHLLTLSPEAQHDLRITVAAMKLLLVNALAPKRVAGLAGLMECRSCRAVGADARSMRHRNCFWLGIAE
jgi:hypothetical protein